MHEDQVIVEQGVVGDVEQGLAYVRADLQFAAAASIKLTIARGGVLQPPGWRSVATYSRPRST